MSATARLSNLHLQTSLALAPRRKIVARKAGRAIATGRQPEYRPVKVVGQGAFGVVYCARTRTGDIVAIKKVLQDPRYKNRELEIMQIVKNPYCVTLRNFFKTPGKMPSEIYLNLVMDYLPSSLHDLVANYRKNGKYPPPRLIARFGVQLFAGLDYLHSIGIVHRDMKPENVLVDPESQSLKICDFGSAKVLRRGEKSVSYIASRYYRAPELLLDCELYTTAIDIWAAGCVIAEMLLAGRPMFAGVSNYAQLVEIVKVFGPPSETDLSAFHHSPDIPTFPKQCSSLETKLPGHTPPEMIDLLAKIFVYNPSRRPTAAECVAHPCFRDVSYGIIMKNEGLPSLEKPVCK